MENDVSKKIYFLLQTQGIPYDVAAEKLGLPENHFQHIVKGEAQPTLRIIQKLSELFNVKPEFFSDNQFVSDPSNEKETSPPSSKKPLTIKDLTIKVQAVIECLVEKNLITAEDMKNKTKEVTGRITKRKKKKRTSQRS